MRRDQFGTFGSIFLHRQVLQIPRNMQSAGNVLAAPLTDKRIDVIDLITQRAVEIDGFDLLAEMIGQRTLFRTSTFRSRDARMTTMIFNVFRVRSEALPVALNCKRVGPLVVVFCPLQGALPVLPVPLFRFSFCNFLVSRVGTICLLFAFDSIRVTRRSGFAKFSVATRVPQPPFFEVLRPTLSALRVATRRTLIILKLTTAF